MNFKLIHFLLGIKVPHKSPNFESQLSSALVKICQIPHVIFQTISKFFLKFCVTLYCHERTPLYFLDQTLHTFHGRDQSKCKFFRLLSARIKIHQILFSTEELSLMTLQSDTKFKEIITCNFKYGMRNFVNFHPTTQKFQNFNSMGYFCPKYMRFELKKIRRNYLS